jgi:hypothetical protein
MPRVVEVLAKQRDGMFAAEGPGCGLTREEVEQALRFKFIALPYHFANQIAQWKSDELAQRILW